MKTNLNKGSALIIIVIVLVLVGIIAVVFAKILPETGVVSELTKLADSRKSDEWVSYTSTEGHFKVLFPVDPKVDSTEEKLPGLEETAKVVLYSSEPNPDLAYQIVYLIFPPSVAEKIQMGTESEKKLILEQFVNGVFAKEGNQIVSSQYAAFNSDVSFDFHAKNETENVYVNGKAFVINKVIYLMYAMKKGEEVGGQELDKYYSSFEKN